MAGALTGTIPAGASSVTITGLTYSKEESGVVLTASRTSGDVLTSGNSAGFNVVDNSTTIIRSLQSGNWNTTTTWSCNCVPQLSDTVKIKTSHTVNVTSSPNDQGLPKLYVNRVTTTIRVIAVIMPNIDSIRPDDWRPYRVKVDDIEAITGYNYLSNVPVAIQNVIEAITDNVSN